MARTREFQCRVFNRHQAAGRNQRKLIIQAYFYTALILCAAVLLLSGRQTCAQTAVSQASADWKALGWTLPESFAPDQIALFKGLNAARGTWSFQAEAVDRAATSGLTGKLIVTGGPQGGMASTWNLIWSWPAENPQQAIVETIVATPGKNQQFSLMLVRFGPLKYSEPQLKPPPRGQRTIFMGHWDAGKQTLNWNQQRLPETPAAQETTQQNRAVAKLEMVITADGKISLQGSENLQAGQILTGGVIVRLGDPPPPPEQDSFLTGMHRFPKGSEISDRRITRYLPADATDVRLISDRNGHMAHYRISAESFDTFLKNSWDRYTKERAANPESWIHYSDGDITAAREGSLVGRYEPKVRSTEILFDKPVVWEPLENATKYEGPRKKSAAGATYYFDREKGIACHDAGYW